MTLEQPGFEQTELGNIVQRYKLQSGNELVIAASDVRKERTGVHARLLLLLNGRSLGHDNFNIEKDADRVRLANSAHKQLGKLDADEWPANRVKRALDDFALDLWPYFVRLASLQVDSSYEIDAAPPTFLLEPYVMDEAGTILFGPPDRGKSWTALILACNAHSGLGWPWPCPTGPVPTLYINLERSAGSLFRRVGNVSRAMGLPDDFRLPLLNARGRTLADVVDGVRAAIRRDGYRLVVLDSISRAGAGDLTENQPANRTADLLNSLGVAWIGIGHAPRGDESHLYGSMMFDAAADVMINLVSERTLDGSLGVSIQTTKANDMRWPRPETWAYRFDDFGLAKVEPASEREFGDIQPPANRVLAHLTANGKCSAKSVEDATGIPYSSAQRLLNNAVRDGLAGVELSPATGNGRGRPVKLYFALSQQQDTYSHAREKVGTMRNSLSEGGDSAYFSESPSLRAERKEKDGFEANDEPDYDPCAVCREKLPPELYTSDGRPLCATCATED